MTTLLNPPITELAELDTALRDVFMDLLLQQCRAAGSALVFVSHDERLASRFDERLSLAEINHAAAQALP